MAVNTVVVAEGQALMYAGTDGTILTEALQCDAFYL